MGACTRAYTDKDRPRQTGTGTQTDRYTDTQTRRHADTQTRRHAEDWPGSKGRGERRVTIPWIFGVVAWVNELLAAILVHLNGKRRANLCKTPPPQKKKKGERRQGGKEGRGKKKEKGQHTE